MNDIINLDTLGIPSLGIVSNRMTEQQGDKIARFAKQLDINRVNLMFDCDEAITAGAKGALWFFAERQLGTRLEWSSTMDENKCLGRKPA